MAGAAAYVVPYPYIPAYGPPTRRTRYWGDPKVATVVDYTNLERIIYVTTRKATTCGYPWQMSSKWPNKGYKGECVAADGSAPLVAIVQGTATLRDDEDNRTALWEYSSGNNNR